MAQGNGLNILQRLSNIEAELERICAVLAGFEQAHQVQKKRIEELERVLNTLRGSQPEVSTAPTGHERGQMGDDVSMASNAHESDASMNDLRMGSPNNNVGDGSNIFDATLQPRSDTGPLETQETGSQMGRDDPLDVPTTLTTLYDGMRMPALIESLPPLQHRDASTQDQINPFQLFELCFLKEMLGGVALSHGRYSIASNNQPNGGIPQPFPAVREWAAFDRDYDPLLPEGPTQHGVKISSYMQYSEDTGSFPLFIQEKNSTGYMYYGHYQEPRRPDRVGGCEMSQLPEHVKEHWAEELGYGGKGLEYIPALRKMWPMVKVGWWDPVSRTMINYDENLEDEQSELYAVERHITKTEAKALTPEQIMAAFNVPDTQMSAPSLRLFYEYLQCVFYDAEFHGKLVAMGI